MSAEHVSLSVSWTCTGCWEDAEVDDDYGLICRRCSVRFDDRNDGAEGVRLSPQDFLDQYGDYKPAPSRREVLDDIKARYGQSPRSTASSEVPKQEVTP